MPVKLWGSVFELLCAVKLDCDETVVVDVKDNLELEVVRCRICLACKNRHASEMHQSLGLPPLKGTGWMGGVYSVLVFTPNFKIAFRITRTRTSNSYSTGSCPR
jgi:hypothetical protein